MVVFMKRFLSLFLISLFFVGALSGCKKNDAMGGFLSDVVSTTEEYGYELDVDINTTSDIGVVSGDGSDTSSEGVVVNYENSVSQGSSSSEGSTSSYDSSSQADECKHKNVVIDPAVEPTYISTGLTEGSHCGDCGKILVAQEKVKMSGRYELPEIPLE